MLSTQEKQKLMEDFLENHSLESIFIKHKFLKEDIENFNFNKLEVFLSLEVFDSKLILTVLGKCDNKKFSEKFVLSK